MKRKELTEYRKKTSTEMEKTIRAERIRLADLKANAAMGKVKNVKEIRALRVKIAQLMTLCAASGELAKNDKKR